MSTELKIKSKHLALEPAIIRKEERKLLKQARWFRSKQEFKESDLLIGKAANLAQHRKWNVRNEARATFLARAYIAGTPYSKVERRSLNWKVFKLHIYPRIVAMVAKYGSPEDRLQKMWNPKTFRNEYNEAQHNLLQAKICRWFET